MLHLSEEDAETLRMPPDRHDRRRGERAPQLDQLDDRGVAGGVELIERDVMAIEPLSACTTRS